MPKTYVVHNVAKLTNKDKDDKTTKLIILI